MQQKQFIEGKVNELVKSEAFECIEDLKDTRWTSDYIISFLSTALKEIVEEHFKEIMVARRQDIFIPGATNSMINESVGFNQALDQITSRHKEFLE